MSTATQSPMSGMDSFAALFEESLSRQEMRAGEVITAEVVDVSRQAVMKQLRALNGLTSATLSVGQALVVPVYR